MPSAFVLKLRSHMLCATWATERDGRRAESVVRGVHQLTFRADGEAGPLTFLVSHTSQNVEYEGTVRTAPCAACAVRVRWNAGFQRATYFLSFDDWAPDSHPLGRRAHSDCVCLSESLFVGALFLWAKPNGVAVVIGRFEGLLAINFARLYETGMQIGRRQRSHGYSTHTHGASGACTRTENGARAVQSNPQCASKHHGRGGHG